MTPSYAVKKGVRYRYYVSCVLAQGRKEEAGSVSRIAAADIETLVINAIAPTEHPNDRNPDRDRIAQSIERIVAGKQSVEIRLAREQTETDTDTNTNELPDTIVVPWSPAPFRRKREVLQPADGVTNAARSIRIEARTKLVDAIARGRRWLEEAINDPKASVQTIAIREGLPERSARSIMSLSFLAPDIVKAAVDGTLPRGFGVSRLIDLPAAWAEQRHLLGLAEPMRVGVGLPDRRG